MLLNMVSSKSKVPKSKLSKSMVSVSFVRVRRCSKSLLVRVSSYSRIVRYQSKSFVKPVVWKIKRVLRGVNCWGRFTKNRLPEQDTLRKKILSLYAQKKLCPTALLTSLLPVELHVWRILLWQASRGMIASWDRSVVQEREVGGAVWRMLWVSLRL